ncbi:MAG: hypothetical protein LBS11_02235 [Oscillospiraceae bacterium]|jgi:hypothetical protein|nr:hypothetical protein [Oscillospiraceae bacterium]
MPRTRLVLVIIAIIMAVVLFVSVEALAGEDAPYLVPDGFTATDNIDGITGSTRITLTSADGQLVFVFAAARVREYEGLVLSDVPDEDVPGLLSEMGLNLEEMGVTAEFVGDFDEDTGEEYAYIAMFDKDGWQEHAVFINEDGWVEYQGLARRDGPLTDGDWEEYYRFYDSIKLEDSRG